MPVFKEDSKKSWLKNYLNIQEFSETRYDKVFDALNGVWKWGSCGKNVVFFKKKNQCALYAADIYLATVVCVSSWQKSKKSIDRCVMKTADYLPRPRRMNSTMNGIVAVNVNRLSRTFHSLSSPRKKHFVIQRLIVLVHYRGAAFWTYRLMNKKKIFSKKREKCQRNKLYLDKGNEYDKPWADDTAQQGGVHGAQIVEIVSIFPGLVVLHQDHPVKKLLRSRFHACGSIERGCVVGEQEGGRCVVQSCIPVLWARIGETRGPECPFTRAETRPWNVLTLYCGCDSRPEIVLENKFHYNTLLHYTTLYYTILHYTTLYYTIIHITTHYYTILHYTAL